MGSIDKAAIVFSIAIALVGVGIAAVGNSADNTPTAAPFVSTQISEQKSLEEKTETTSLQDRQAEAAAEAAAEKAAAPKTVVVDIPVGTAVPGCETTDECFTPASISINAGDTVEWANVDTAAHTVTGGSPADGPSGVFDSSLLMGSGNYSFTFDDAGSYDYFCMVHPWMVGSVSVN